MSVLRDKPSGQGVVGGDWRGCDRRARSAWHCRAALVERTPRHRAAQQLHKEAFSVSHGKRSPHRRAVESAAAGAQPWREAPPEGAKHGAGQRTHRINTTHSNQRETRAPRPQRPLDSHRDEIQPLAGPPRLLHSRFLIEDVQWHGDAFVGRNEHQICCSSLSKPRAERNGSKGRMLAAVFPQTPPVVA